MIRKQAIERLNKLSSLLDLARDAARTDAQQLHVLLDDAASTLEAVGPLQDAGAGDAEFIMAARRARASHAALHKALRDELTLIGRQIAQNGAGAQAAARYVAPLAVSGRRLDRRG